MGKELPPISDAGAQSPDEQDLVNHVKKKIEEIRITATRTANESIWLQNSAYLKGYSGLVFDSASRQMKTSDSNTPFLRRNRIHVNKILPTVQNRLAKLCKSPPKYDVRPNSSNTDDKEASRLSLQVLTFLWDKLKLNQKRIPLYMWKQQCGHSYIKVGWDETQGEPMVDPVTNDFSYEGEVMAEVCSSFEVFPDPLAKTDTECRYMIHAKVRSLDYYKMKYPGRGDAVKEEAAWLLSLQYEARIGNMNQRGTAGGLAQSAAKNSAIELCYYEKRSKNYPNGRMIVVANGVLLVDKELPCGKIPLVKFDDIVIGGSYYPEAIITHLKPIQDQYNVTISKRAQWVSKMLSGKLIAPRGIGLTQESLNDESGEVVYFTASPVLPNGGMPQALQMPVIPQYAYQEQDRLDAMFNEISGISGPSKGELPSASIPAIGLQLLIESDDSRIGIVTENDEESWARVGELILKYVEKYYVMPRLLKLAGRDLEYTVKSFSGPDLKGNTDCMVVRGSMLPGSKTMRRNDISNAFSSGLLGDPKDPKVQEKVLGLMEFGDIQGMWEDYGLTMAQIKRGIDKLESGLDVAVSEFDNNALWLQELNRYRLTEKYEGMDASIQGLFLNNIEARVQALMKLNGAPQPEDVQKETQLMQMKAQDDQQASNSLLQAKDAEINMAAPQQNVGGI